MRVRLLDELWVTQAPDGTLELGVPTVTRRGGGSAPGVVTPEPRVLLPGAILRINEDLVARITDPVYTMHPNCQGCTELADAELGKQFPKDHTFEHNHGRR